MTRKTINIIIGCVFAFFVVFFAGSFAYEQYLINKSDEAYNNQQEEIDEIAKENQSGQTNDEAKGN